MSTPTPQLDRDLDTSLEAMPLLHGTLPRWVPWAIPAATIVLMAAALALTQIGIAPLVVGGFVITALVTYLASRAVEGGRRAIDRLVTITVTSAFLLALVPLVSVILTVVSNGIARFDGKFFTFSMNGVIGGGGGAYHAIVGTLVITGLTVVISLPIGLLAAIYLVEYSSGRLAGMLRFFVDVMTGIPSIVAGLFSYAMFALIFGPGVRLGIAGAVALSVLMIPIVVRSTEEMLKIVPNDLREASYALGVSKWRTIVKVVLPTSVAGIVTGVMLAVARAVGETAPLLITVGVTKSTNWNPFSERMPALPVFAYNQYKAPGIPNQAFIDRAWAAALTLIIIVMVLNLIARLISRLFAPKS